jgi:biotin carboxyl carrier protein
MKEDAPPAPAEAVPEAAAPVPAPEPEVPTAPPATATKVPAPAPSVAPLGEAPPDFRLNGIIYSSVPSAIVNGRMVKVGDQVNGATVVAIEQTNVTLQVNGQRKTYALR